MPDISIRSMLRSGEFGEDLGKDHLGVMMREQQRRQQHEVSDREMELNMYRSGSAPPTVEGSLSSAGGLFGDVSMFSEFADRNKSEEELRSDPAYVHFYYSNVNMNPRLPPPLLSKEDWRVSQRLQGGGGGGGGGGPVGSAIGDRRKVMSRGGGVGVGGDGNGNGGANSSLFSTQLGYNGQKEENGVEPRKSQGGSQWGGDGLIGLPGLGLGARDKSLSEIFQDDISHARSVSRHPSRPVSRNAFDDTVETSDSQFAQLHHELASMDALHSGENIQGMSAVQTIGASASHSYASALGASLSRSTTPDPQVVARAPSPRLPAVGVGRVNSIDKRSLNAPNSFNRVSPSMADSTDLLAAFSGMNLSTNGIRDELNHSGTHIQHETHEQPNLYNLQGDQNLMKQHSYLNNSEAEHFHMHSVPHSVKGLYPNMGKSNEVGMDLNNSSLMADGQVELRKPAMFANSYLKGPPTPILNGGGSSPSHNQNVDSFVNYGLNGYAINPGSPSMMGSQLGSGNVPSIFENVGAASAMGVGGMDPRTLGGGLALGPNSMATAADLQNLNRIGNHNAGNALQMSLTDPLYLQYLRSTDYAAAQAASLKEPIMDRDYMVNSYMDILGFQKAYLGALLASQRSQYSGPYTGKSGGVNNGFYGSPVYGLGMPYPGSPMAGSLLPNSPVGPGSPIRHGERTTRFPSGMRNFAGGVMGAWHSEAGSNLDESFTPSLLDEFKSNKTKCFELLEIIGHVVEFSADQYGSRFIQQKLETATTEEKNMVFREIMPQALTLMTDVFGNYVIQKFFEHGTPSQIRELANQLHGNVLTLSLQMYGCRVIQKAIEVVVLDQQTKMVTELDGNIMRCVRDQNGNHVIQKCIECIPEDAIQFIVSTFYDQVVTLSTHPYGCRVIQRVLEHCHDPKTQRIMMDEILLSVCMLAQDQYGNYVVQHVLEHGKPHERTSIIKKLTGQIVQMSQQKFASNVVEKCLTFGDPVERQILVTEMLGSTDENEPLQAMMKDQFANYVVQKVLETCDEQQLELILNRIKVHLNALKKYTYGKHIVARVEKLVAAGEKRISIQAMHVA